MCFRALLCCGLVGAVATIVAACSVLESRGDCPCYVHLDLSDPANAVCDSLRLRLLTRGGFSWACTVHRDDYDDEICVKVPSRDAVLVSALNADVSRTEPDGALRIDIGEECPEAYMQGKYFSTRGESCRADVRLGKNFCGVTMNFIADNLALYELHVLGNVCGYALDGQMLDGKFDYSPSEGGGVCYFRLPRQKDSSLLLGISRRGSDVTRYFALGNYICQSGYDWNAPDLEDLTICVDHAQTDIVISIGDWSGSESYEVSF